MPWQRLDIGFDLLDDMSDMHVATVRIATPIGVLLVMAEPVQSGNTIYARALHTNAAAAMPTRNQFGPANLQVIARHSSRGSTTMSLSLKERFERQGAVQGIDRVRCGSPGAFALTALRELSEVKPVSAALALARRHVPMLRAKRAVEAMLQDQRAFIEVPAVENFAALRDELRGAGVAIHLQPSGKLDVRTVRARTGHTQEQFALRYGIDLATLRNWEQGRNEPDLAAQSYLRMIAAHPRQVEELLWSA